ncbi:MAG: hypothetical protein JWM68_2082 [Verrucomicrobiales bacterium]|nr:hypothetical protein [Verrucomicrobiales bacterium]
MNNQSHSSADGDLAETVSEKITKLERRNQLLGVIAPILIVGVLLGFGFMNRQMAKFRDSAKAPAEFVLRDQNGTVRWQVAIGEGNAVYESFFDATGKSRVAIGMNEENDSCCALWDGQGNQRLNLIAQSGAGDRRGVGLYLSPPENTHGNRGGIALQCNNDKKSSVSMFDPNGVNRYFLGSAENDGFHQIIFDPAGKMRLASYSTAEQAANCLVDADGQIRSLAMTDDEGDFFMQMKDRKGKSRIDFAISDEVTRQTFWGPDGEAKSFVQVNSDGQLIRDTER